MGRSKIDRNARRAEIATAALHLCLSRPREEVTVAAVAEAAGLTFWQVYRTTGAVDRLYRIAVLQLVDQIAGALKRPRRSHDAVHAAIAAYTEHVAEVVEGEAFGNLLYLLIRDGCGEPWLSEVYEDRVARPIRTGLREVIQDAAAKRGAAVGLREDAEAHFLQSLQAALAFPRLLPGVAAASRASRNRVVAALTRETVSASYSLDFASQAA